MKRTISKRVFLRLTAQADEADIYGHTDIASNLTSQILKYADDVRDETENEDYVYSKDDMMEEIKDNLWDCASRMFDYYDEIPDARDIQSIIDFEAESFISYIESLVNKDVGPFEPATAGEEKEDDEDFVDDDEEKFVSLSEDFFSDDVDEAEEDDEEKQNNEAQED